MQFIAAFLLLLVSASPALAERIDLYNDKSQREGYGKIDTKTGRVDLYDKWSNRKGYGKIRVPTERRQDPKPEPKKGTRDGLR